MQADSLPYRQSMKRQVLINLALVFALLCPSYGIAQGITFSVGPDETLSYPSTLTNLADEHTTIIPPAPGSNMYRFFASSAVQGGSGGTVVLETADLTNFTFASGYATQVMKPAIAFTSCKTTYDPEFDLNYAAPGSVIQDPTLPPGNLIMIYEAENHCPGAVWQHDFYATVGFARSSDNGKTWPAVVDAELGGPDRYPVLKNPTPQPTTSPAVPQAIGNAIPSAIAVTNSNLESYLYVVYSAPGPGADGMIRVARAKLGASGQISFLKWYQGAFTEPGIGGQDSGVLPSRGCTDRQANGQISYSDTLGLYVMVYVCVDVQPGTSQAYQAAWYFSTATSLDLQNWTSPQQIANSQFPIVDGCASDGTGSSFDGWYPSLMSSGVAAGHISNTGKIFFMNGCDRGKREFMSRTFTVTLSGPGGTALQYYPLPRPVRLLDTRSGETAACNNPGTPLTGGTPLPLLARAACQGVTIPANAQAVVGNAAVVNFLSGPGYITLYPSNAAQPLAANLNYTANDVLSNAFTVGLGGDGKFDIFASTTTHFVVDITGYYAPPGAGGLYYHPLPHPVRRLDTRAGETTACTNPGTPLTAGVPLAQQARGSCQGTTIPAAAQAVAGNAAVVNFLSGPGYITLYPSNAAQPLAANLNYNANDVLSNAFTVGLGSDGTFDIFASSTAHFVVDITGYYSAEATDVNGAGLYYYPLSSPVRRLDTRPGETTACTNPGTPLTAGVPLTQQAHGSCQGTTIPAAAQAIVGNAAVVNFLSGPGYITLYPGNAAQPLAANLNYNANDVLSNAFTVGLGSDGTFDIFASSTTHFVVDITGYFAP